MCGPAVSVPTVLIIGSGLAINVVQIVSIYRECRDARWRILVNTDPERGLD